MTKPDKRCTQKGLLHLQTCQGHIQCTARSPPHWLKEPGKHDVQLMDATSAADAVPAGHGMQLDIPVVLANVPAAHGIQDDAAELKVKLPAAHGVRMPLVHAEPGGMEVLLFESGCCLAVAGVVYHPVGGSGCDGASWTVYEMPPHGWACALVDDGGHV